MYKIYINETPVILVSRKDLASLPPSSPDTFHVRYTGNPKSIFQPVDMLEKGRQLNAVIIHHDKLEALWQDFQGIYKIIEAAGGLIFTPDQKLLMIFRRGFWDLPKGKIDPGETPEQAAIREVEEETGAQSLKLESFLTYTYHTYKDKKGRRILKKTYWYRMTAPEQALVEQTEEDIEIATWKNPIQFLEEKQPVYKNIKDLIIQFCGTTR